MIKQHLLRRLVALGVVGMLSGLGTLFFIGSYISQPRQHPVGDPINVLNAEILEVDGLKGWFVPADRPSTRCILLMHGIGADRRSMTSRALFLKESGYASLMFDFQAHGESVGERITFGHVEAANAARMLEHLRMDRGCERVGVIGTSLGGAASLLGDGPLEADAFVLEAVYPTIDAAVSNRLAMRLGTIGRWVTPLLTWQIPLRLDISRDQLRPIDNIERLDAPVLIVAGSHDLHTPLSESHALFDAALGPKDLWILDGAAHQDFHAFDRKTYEERILAFFREHLH